MMAMAMAMWVYTQLIEYALCRISLLIEAGKFQEAWDYTLANEQSILDKDSLGAYKVDVLIKLDRASEAEQVARKLLATNPENLKHHNALQRAKSLVPDANGNLTAEQIEQLSRLYDELAQELPKWCKAVQIVPLSFLPGMDGSHVH
jgi:predicted Zn-dependent protease